MADVKDAAHLRAFANAHVARFAAQAGAATTGAGAAATVARQVFAHHHRVGLAVAALHVDQDAFERVFFAELFAAAIVQAVVELDLFVARAVEQHLLHFGAEVFKRGIEVKLVVLGQALQQGEVVCVAAVPAFDGTTAQAQRGEGHHTGGVEKVLVTQAVTRRARAHR